MQFVWAGNRQEQYSRRWFSIDVDGKCDKLVVCAVDFYRVYFDKKFVCYGPERTAQGYSRKREISLDNVKRIDIEVAGYNHLCYACDMQPPFFGAEIYSGEKLVYNSKDFSCYEKTDRLKDVPRFSGQRTGIEYIDLTCVKDIPLALYDVQAPTILSGIGDTADYKCVFFNKLSEGEFVGFDAVMNARCESNPLQVATQTGFWVTRDFLEKTSSGYKYIDFALDNECTGFIKVKISAEQESEIFLVMDEYLENGKWTFRRSGCNDLVVIKVPKGEHDLQTFEPYALKHLRVVYKGNIDIEASLVTLQNVNTNFISVSGDSDLVKIFNAAKSSFSQNAVDLFTDCPGRERAGWLCDSYFMGIAERVFTGKSLIERNFLENYILANTPEIDHRMLPMSFPSEGYKDRYIPNWAMWFVLELKEHFLRTGNRELIDRAKDKVYGLIDFFSQYENEYGLLEDLESWVFVEWSMCNDKEYVKGVNYPSNMLYCAMLLAVDYLYGDTAIKEKAQKIKEKIIEFSFNGEFFIENSVREDGKLVHRIDHLTETCQYYALFFDVYNEAQFSKNIIENFGPLRKEGVYPLVAKSNMFIGNYLRFFYLAQNKEYDRILAEMTDYFRLMVEKTGTLWEHDKSKASCNHGFASVAAHLILQCIAGYQGVKDGKPIFNDLEKAKKYGVAIKVNQCLKANS